MGIMLRLRLGDSILQKPCKTRETFAIFSAMFVGKVRYRHGFDARPDPDMNSFNLRIGLLWSLRFLPDDISNVEKAFHDCFYVYKFL